MSYPRILLVVVVLATLPSVGAAQQLSGDVLPDHYDLRLTIDFEKNTIAGEETILVEIVKATTKITLNAVGITVEEASIAAGWSTQPATVTLNQADESATLTVPRRLAAGPARLHIVYTARVNAELRGLYFGRANERMYAATQFEATDARRAFPCFDQPDMKASFSLTATVPQGTVAISNGRVLSDAAGPGANQHTVRFSTSRKMSTYLLALAVGDFECLETKVDVPGPTPRPGPRDQSLFIRVCAVRGRQQLGQFALAAAEAVFRFYNSYFTTKYPFGKLDLVALPDFAGGGMENTAAIFFDEHDLLVDPRTAPLEAQKLVASTVSHEIAHEWLGDLVTMKWWDDLWLKEGLATWLETKPLAAWKPEWHVELDEVASAEEAMAVDALDATRPIRMRVTTPAEIDESYDAIVYQKAAAVVRMVEAFVGPEAFRAAVNAYISRFAYGNATAEDFRAAVAENTVRPVGDILRTFLDLPGVPVVAIAARCDTEATSLATASQQRFRAERGQTTQQGGTWAIPVATRALVPSERPGAASDLRVGTHATTNLLAAKEQTFNVAGCTPVILGNADAKGYYRTSYPPNVLQQLGKEAARALMPVERLRVLDDQWARVRAGSLDVGAYLSLLAGYGHEQHGQVVDRMASTLAVIDDELTTDADRETFRGWVRSLVAPIVAAPTPQATGADAAEQQAVQARALFALGAIGRDADVLARARAVVLTQRTSPDDQAAGSGDAPALLDTFAKLAAIEGDEGVFDRFVANAARSDSPDAYARDVQALGYFTAPPLVERALKYALSDVPGDAAAGLFATLIENRSSRSAAWAFVKGHWQELMKKDRGNETAAELMTAAGSFCDAKGRDDVRAFFGEKGYSGSRTLRQTLERIQSCIDLRSSQQPNLQRWLEGAR